MKIFTKRDSLLVFSSRWRVQRVKGSELSIKFEILIQQVLKNQTLYRPFQFIIKFKPSSTSCFTAFGDGQNNKVLNLSVRILFISLAYSYCNP